MAGILFGQISTVNEGTIRLRVARHVTFTSAIVRAAQLSLISDSRRFLRLFHFWNGRLIEDTASGHPSRKAKTVCSRDAIRNRGNSRFSVAIIMHAGNEFCFPVAEDFAMVPDYGCILPVIGEVIELPGVVLQIEQEFVRVFGSLSAPGRLRQRVDHAGGSATTASRKNPHHGLHPH